jgi:hypothetical protein
MRIRRIPLAVLAWRFLRPYPRPGRGSRAHRSDDFNANPYVRGEQTLAFHLEP